MIYGKGELKINILLVNYRYFISGGPERYMFGLIRLLESKGHKVVPFSINYARNIPTEYSKYFLPPPIDEDSVYFKDYRFSPTKVLKLLSRVFYSFEARQKIRKIIKEEKIDIAYILHHINTMSPSIIDGCKDMKIPVVLRVSDFYLLCPGYLFLRNREVCEKCLKGYYQALKWRCNQRSFGVTFVRVLSMYLHKILGIYEKVDAFITPSRFLRAKMIDAGFDGSKIYHLPTPVEIEDKIPTEPTEKNSDYVLYFGRISKEKGVEYLIKAFETLRFRPEAMKLKLKIVGNSNDCEDIKLKRYVEEKKLSNIEFLGFKKAQELNYLIKNSLFVVVPSICYENMPITVLEAFAHGKPVVGSQIGSIPEIVKDGVNGLLFEPKNTENLVEKILFLVQNTDKVSQMGNNARRFVEEEFNPDKHYESLITIFNQVMGKTISEM